MLLQYMERGGRQVETLPSACLPLVQKDGCGSRRAEAFIGYSIHKQVPQVSPRLRSAECGLDSGNVVTRKLHSATTRLRGYM